MLDGSSAVKQEQIVQSETDHLVPEDELRYSDAVIADYVRLAIREETLDS